MSDRSFEIPLAAAHKSYIETITIRQKEYEDLLAIRTTAIRQTEAANFKAGKQRTRDLNSFRRALEKLQEQVKEVEAVKRAHYQEVLEGEREVWSHCAAQVSSFSLLVSTQSINSNSTIQYRSLCYYARPWTWPIV